jgi:hypothetical protein
MAIWAVSLLNTELSPRVLTRMVKSFGIRSLFGFGKLAPPSPFSALPPKGNSYG